MKLILCPKCNDIVRLIDSKRSCRCGASYGWYKNSRNAIVNKTAIPIGIDNRSLAKAVRRRPVGIEASLDGTFNAFIIPYLSSSVEVINE